MTNPNPWTLALPALPWRYVLAGDGLHVLGGNGFQQQHFLTIKSGAHSDQVEALIRKIEADLWELRNYG